MCKQVMMFEHRGAVLTSGKSEQGNRWQSEVDLLNQCGNMPRT